MAPEAYTLKAALDGWMAHEDDQAIRRRAAQAYDRYQKCGGRAALRLFATKWGKVKGVPAAARAPSHLDQSAPLASLFPTIRALFKPSPFAPPDPYPGSALKKCWI